MALSIAIIFSHMYTLGQIPARRQKGFYFSFLWSYEVSWASDKGCRIPKKSPETKPMAVTWKGVIDELLVTPLLQSLLFWAWSSLPMVPYPGKADAPGVFLQGHRVLTVRELGKACPVMFPCWLKQGEWAESEHRNGGVLNAAQTSRNILLPLVAEELPSSLLFSYNKLGWSEFSVHKGCQWNSRLRRIWEMHAPKERACCWWPAWWLLGSARGFVHEDFPAFGNRPHIFSSHTELMCCSASLCGFMSLAETRSEECSPLLFWCGQEILAQLHGWCSSPESEQCSPARNLVPSDCSIALGDVVQGEHSSLWTACFDFGQPISQAQASRGRPALLRSKHNEADTDILQVSFCGS